MTGEYERSPSSNTATSEQEMKIMLEDLQAEFDAFRESSAELENELERELERVEARARKSEEELRKKKDSSKDVTARLKWELLASQRDVTELREESHQSRFAVRDKEEALEQLAETERRAQAEVEALRDALDASMEIATFSQTELEELKRTSADTTRHLYEDLEDAQAELALLTPIKSDGNLSRSGSGRHDDGEREAGGGGRRARHFFRMASMEEDSGLEYGSPSVHEEDHSPRLMMTDGAGNVSTLAIALGGGGDGANEGQRPTSVNDKATKLQQELERQLRLSSSSPPPSSRTVAMTTANSRASFTNSASSSNSSSYQTTAGPHKNRRFLDADGPPLSASSAAGAAGNKGFARQGGVTNEGVSSGGTRVCGSRVGEVVVESETVQLVASAGTAGATIGNKDVGFVHGRGRGVYGSWDDDDCDRGGQIVAARRSGGGLRGEHGLGGVIVALSRWRPFGWCQPPPPP